MLSFYLSTKCLNFTDSIFITRHPSEPGLPLGDNLGDLESEVEPNCHIDSFVSGGAKNYSYKVLDSEGNIKKIVTKVRGITQNSGNAELVNYEKLKKIVLEGAEAVYVTDPRKIMRTKDFNIISKKQSKIFQSVNNKRRIVPGQMITLPYGYVTDNNSSDED